MGYCGGETPDLRRHKTGLRHLVQRRSCGHVKTLREARKSGPKGPRALGHLPHSSSWFRSLVHLSRCFFLSLLFLSKRCWSLRSPWSRRETWQLLWRLWAGIKKSLQGPEEAIKGKAPDLCYRELPSEWNRNRTGVRAGDRANASSPAFNHQLQEKPELSEVGRK